MSVSDPGEKIEWGADSEPRKNERVPSLEKAMVPADPSYCLIRYSAHQTKKIFRIFESAPSGIL